MFPQFSCDIGDHEIVRCIRFRRPLRGMWASPEKLSVEIGMSALDVNAQSAMNGHRKLRTGSSDWVGHNGPLDLRLSLNGRIISMPVSGSNGGVQLSTWLGFKGQYPEGRLNTIAAVVDPQQLAWRPAYALAQRICTRAREAGLTIEAGSAEPNRDRDEMNGVAACTIRDDTQSFEARVVPLGRPPAGKYRVEVSVHAHFEPSLMMSDFHP